MEIQEVPAVYRVGSRKFDSREAALRYVEAEKRVAMYIDGLPRPEGKRDTRETIRRHVMDFVIWELGNQPQSPVAAVR